jgi:predicted nucleic acid-binding protein
LIYLDSSALVKLAVTEPETAALTDWLGHSANTVRVSSPIVRVEVPRAVWRSDPGSLPQAYMVVRRVRDIRITASVLTRAAGARPVALRALDAIHLASALAVRHDLTAFVCYDKRLLAAAQEAGLPTASPA